MSEQSIPSAEEPVHVFDQTNGVLGDDPEAPKRARRRIGAADGDLPGATHVVIGGY